MFLMLITVSVSLLTLALASWLGYQILQQNGRILFRIETLEEQLKQRGGERTVQQAQPAQQPGGLPAGSPAPDFRLPDLSGKLSALSSFRGRWVLLIFFNIHCGFCTRMAPALKALTSHPSETGPETLIVATGDPVENAAFFRTNGIECPVLLQNEMEVASLFRVQGTPMGYLVDEQGKIASGLAAGEAALLALVGVSAPEGSGIAPTGNGAQSGGGNGHHHPIPKGNRPLEDSQINRSGLRAGTTAPPFSLPLVGGDDEAETLSLESFRGRRVLLVFSDPHCGPCAELAVKLERQWREHSMT